MHTSGLLLAAAATVSAAAVSAQSAAESIRYTATGVADVLAAQATAPTRSPVSHVKGKAFDRIAIVWLENTDYTLAVNDPNLAWLAKKGITLSNYFALTHPSEPNYCASHGGDYFGMNDDAFDFIDANISTVVDLLEQRGISWGEYQEDMPYSGFEGFGYVNQQTGANDYVRKHNPAILYNANTQRADRLAQIKNLTMFHRDLEAGTLPQWMFITPNMTSDGHDTSVTVAGAWTRNFLEPLLNDRRFMQNTLVLVTFDESGTYSIQNRVLGILLGDAVPADRVGSTDDHVYTHYSELATVEANWDLPTLGRWDVGANVFDLVAKRTGDRVQPVDPAVLAGRFLNQSYDGVFNSKKKYAVYPKPNLCLEKHGRRVADFVQEAWRDSTAPSYYQDAVLPNDGLVPPPRYGLK